MIVFPSVGRFFSAHFLNISRAYSIGKPAFLSCAARRKQAARWFAFTPSINMRRAHGINPEHTVACPSAGGVQFA